jgi:hypothetical protein
LVSPATDAGPERFHQLVASRKRRTFPVRNWPDDGISNVVAVLNAYFASEPVNEAAVRVATSRSLGR